MPISSRLVFLLGFGSFFAGCSLPGAAYQQVDRESPAFKAAVAQETEHQQAAGKSPSAAERIAANKTAARFVENEKVRRLAVAAPLLQAMATLEKPRGCWTYTVTTTTLRDGQVTALDVVHYDPFQPEEKIWTLISHNGIAPDETIQADFRARQLKAWRKDLGRPPKFTESENVRLMVLFNQFEASEPAPDSATIFKVLRDRAKIPLAGDIPPSEETFTISHEALVRRTSKLLDSSSAIAGTMKFDYSDSTVDYAVIDPAVPPFVVKRVAHWRMRFFGKDSGAMERVDVYSDYHRVKCYDDRFETHIGMPNVLEVAPD
jgi:hypothetical protein